MHNSHVIAYYRNRYRNAYMALYYGPVTMTAACQRLLRRAIKVYAARHEAECVAELAGCLALLDVVA